MKQVMQGFFRDDYLSKPKNHRNKIEVLQNLCKKWQVPVIVHDVCGIPAVNPQKVNMFPFKYKRINNEINRLWDFFIKAENGNISDADFADIESIYSIGKTKLTEALFLQKPVECLCIDGKSIPFLKSNGINPEFNSYTELQAIFQVVKSKILLPFYEISHFGHIQVVYGGKQPNYFRIGTKEGDNGPSRLPEMIENDVISIGWSEIGNLEDIEPFNRKHIQKALQESAFYVGDNRTASRKAGEIYSFVKDIKPGDYVLAADGGAIKAIGKVISDHYAYDNDNLKFAHLRCVKWLKESINDLHLDEGLRTTVWQYKKEDVLNKILTYLGGNKLSETFGTSSIQSEFIANMTMNLILYGPPGTGKTYFLKSQFNEFTTSPLKQTSEQFYREIVADRKWWEILAICLYEWEKAKVPELLKHPLVLAKFGTTEIQHPSQRIWSTLQIHTVDECKNVKLTEASRHGVAIFYKESDSTWRLDDKEAFVEQFGELIELFGKYQGGPANGKQVNRYIFTTFHQSLAYEDFIEGIKPQMNESEESETQEELGYQVEKGIFYYACEEAARLAGYRNLRECLDDTLEGRRAKFESIKDDNEKRFCVFIDEINRANISSVFGELITLIEDDKRLGARHEVIVDKMPYSKRPFGVPSNLYLIGTMNTADRSVEALDTALRRRFAFRHMQPEPDKLGMTVEGIDLNRMLTTINQRLEVLLDADHTIGHAWLWDVKDFKGLKAAFKDKILPLLQEYFYNDYEKIGLVLGEGFVSVQEAKGYASFANFNRNSDVASPFLERQIFKLKNADEDEDLGIEGWELSDFINIYN